MDKNTDLKKNQRYQNGEQEFIWKNQRRTGYIKMGNRNSYGKIKEDLEISKWETGIYMEKLKKNWRYQNRKLEFTWKN